MNDIATVVTTPYPMEGFEGQFLDTGSFYARFAKMGDILREKRQQHYYIQGSTSLSSVTPIQGTYFHSTPRQDTIEVFTVPHDYSPPMIHSQPLPAAESARSSDTSYIGAFNSVYVSFSLAALKTMSIGEPTRTIDLISALPIQKEKTKEKQNPWIRQLRGRLTHMRVTFRSVLEGSSGAAQWDKWFGKLEDCLALDDGWNGDDSPPPQFIAAHHAHVFLNAMRKENYEPTRIAASAMGGIAVTRKNGDKKVLIEFYNDGRTYFLFSDRDSGEMNVQPLSFESLTTFIASMREFLDG